MSIDTDLEVVSPEDSFARIGMIEQRFSEEVIPEPSAMLLLGNGLARLVACGTERRSRPCRFGWRQPMADMFSKAAAYDSYMGGWSRRLAPMFTEFAQVRDGDKVLDVGCGTGVLSQAVAAVARSSEITGIDSSSSFVEHTRPNCADPRIRFDVGNALSWTSPPLMIIGYRNSEALALGARI